MFQAMDERPCLTVDQHRPSIGVLEIQVEELSVRIPCDTAGENPLVSRNCFVKLN